MAKLVVKCEKMEKSRTPWNSEAEKSLIEIWDAILWETGGKMLTQKEDVNIHNKATQQVLGDCPEQK